MLGKVMICPEKFLYVGKNYDMSGKMFFIFGKITMCPEKICMSGKNFTTSLPPARQDFWEKKCKLVTRQILPS
jgi:flavodoxin